MEIKIKDRTFSYGLGVCSLFEVSVETRTCGTISACGRTVYDAVRILREKLTVLLLARRLDGEDPVSETGIESL